MWKQSQAVSDDVYPPMAKDFFVVQVPPHYPAVYRRGEETPCAGHLEEEKPCEGVSRYLCPWVNWLNRVGALLSYAASCMFQSRNSKD